MGLWVCLVGANLVLPFWSILMLIRCKIKLDRWLHSSLDHLHELRVAALSRTDEKRGRANSNGNVRVKPETREEDIERQGMEETVTGMGGVILDLTEHLDRIWKDECGW